MSSKGRSVRSAGVRGLIGIAAVAVHAALLAAIAFVLSPGDGGRPVTLTGWKMEKEVVEPLREEIRPDCLESRPIEQEERVLADPVLRDAKVSDHDETELDARFEESLGKADFISDAPFDGPSTNAAIGIGGGAGKAMGGRGGHRNFRKEAAEPFVREAPPVDREGYDAIEEPGFRDPRFHPLSTFSVDVDTASMSNVRRILREGRLPPAGAVRIEEMINYFSYAYLEPEGEVPFSVNMEVAECPWRPGHRLVRLGLRGRSMEAGTVPPRNLVFLLDVSGSMQPADKLPLVRQAMELLVDRLRREDRVAIVVYAGASGTVLPPTSGADAGRIRDALRRLEAGGSTNGGQGIRRAYALARERFVDGGINRVILATDGDFNVGVTDRSRLLSLIEKEREAGVFLTVLGVGTGNIQDSQMEMLADHGNGNYAYLDRIEEAEKVLVRQADATLVTIAKDVKLQVEFNPARVVAYRLVGYENRTLAARDFDDDRKDSGEIGAGHTVTALYEIAPPGGESVAGVDALRYQDERRGTDRAFGDELLNLKLRYKEPDGAQSRLVVRPLVDPGVEGFAAASEDYRFAAAVACFGLALRGSEHAGEASFALARELCHGALGDDPDGDRRELLELVSLAERLAVGGSR